MNYEKIIVELLGRIQTLEEQVALLMSEKEEKKAENKMTMQDIREHIINLKQSAKRNGESFLVLRSGDVHKELGLKSRLPMVCNAMRQCMSLGDVFLHTTDSGNSSTIEIKYFLN